MNTNTHTMNVTTTQASRRPAGPAPLRGTPPRRRSPVLTRRELKRLVRRMLG